MEYKAADLNSAESKCKDNDASHENGAVTRMRAEIGTNEQSDASRSQAPQGAGNETGMAWWTETAAISVVIQVTDDDGGVDSNSVGIGRVKAKGASSKTGAKWNIMAFHAADGSNRGPHSRSNALPVRSAQTRGLTNTGNICFLNASLQCLGGVWELGEARARQPRQRRSLESRLLECISQLQSRLSPHYPAGHAATDGRLIPHRAAGRRPRILSLPTWQDGPGWPVGSLLQVHQTVLTCSICSNSLVQQAAIAHLSLVLEPPMNSTVNQCLGAFFTSASALDEYRCDSCNRVGTSTRSPSISAPPTILMINLKRLIIGKKIQHLVGFEEELDLNPYMAVKSEPLIYELIGVIEQIGNHKVLFSLEGRQLGIGATTPSSPQLPCTTF